MADPMAEREWVAPFAVDVRRTLSVQGRGRGDPTFQTDESGAIWRTSLTPDGPATIRVLPGRPPALAGHPPLASESALACDPAQAGDPAQASESAMACDPAQASDPAMACDPAQASRPTRSERT